jgi:hypothetical protein
VRTQHRPGKGIAQRSLSASSRHQWGSSRHQRVTSGGNLFLFLTATSAHSRHLVTFWLPIDCRVEAPVISGRNEIALQRKPTNRWPNQIEHLVHSGSRRRSDRLPVDRLSVDQLSVDRSTALFRSKGSCSLRTSHTRTFHRCEFPPVIYVILVQDASSRLYKYPQPFSKPASESLHTFGIEL